MRAGDPTRLARTRIRSALQRALKRLDEGAGDLLVADAVASALLDALRTPKPSGAGDGAIEEADIRHLVHDLRSAGGTLVTWCHVLKRDGLSQAETVHGIEVLERTVRRQLTLAERLAAVTGAEGGNEAPAPEDAEPTHVPAGDSGETDLRGIRVLIVDDDADARDAMQRVLAAYGAEVTTAISAIDAFDVLQRGRPDVLISDIVMPDADGYALLRRVRAPDTGERGMIPAIAVTGNAQTADRRRALGAGYQFHLVKPVRPRELIEAVRSLSGR